MKNIFLALTMCAVLSGCSGDAKTAGTKSLTHDAQAKPSESLLTADDMHLCEQQLGISQPKTAADVYVMSQESIDRVKDCSFEEEKQRMPLLADLIDKYRIMVQQGNKECAKDIGTHYAALCLQKNLDDAADWYNLAVSQKVLTEMPDQPQMQTSQPQH